MLQQQLISVVTFAFTDPTSVQNNKTFTIMDLENNRKYKNFAHQSN